MWGQGVWPLRRKIIAFQVMKRETVGMITVKRAVGLLSDGGLCVWPEDEVYLGHRSGCDQVLKERYSHVSHSLFSLQCPQFVLKDPCFGTRGMLISYYLPFHDQPHSEITRGIVQHPVWINLPVDSIKWFGWPIQLVVMLLWLTFLDQTIIEPPPVKSNL